MQFLTSRVSRLDKPFVIIFLIGFCAIDIAAQAVEVRLSLSSLAPPQVTIQIRGATRRNWSFRNSYGRIVDFSNRIQAVRGRDANGQMVPIRRDAPGVFSADEDVDEISYEVNLSAPSNLADRSHVSWIDSERGLLMLGDLLPEATKDVDLILKLPDGWSSDAGLKPAVAGRYSLRVTENAVFVIGKSLRQRRTRMSGAEVQLVIDGDWAFKDEEVLKIAEKLVGENVKIFKQQLPADAALLLLPLPGSLGYDRWTAETRGSSVVLLIGTNASRSALISRLRVVLAHEMFHLWVPNALRLQGDYDWFFEGFTLYQALLTALRLRYIKFEDYLETLGRVYDSYRSSPERDKLSLLEASERRWTISSSFVYDKGMLVAFIYDLMLRQNSEGRAKITDLYPELLRSAVGSPLANDLLIQILVRQLGMQRFSEQFVTSRADIDLGKIIKMFGLELATEGTRSRIAVSKSLTPEQRRVLKGIGYR